MTANVNELDYASDLDNEIANPTGGTKGKTFFSLTNDAPVATIRFLTYDANNSVLIHNRYPDAKKNLTGVQMPCLTQYGKDCPYCALGKAGLMAQNIETKKVFLFSIYWHEQSCQALFAYTTTGWSPLIAIHTAYKMRMKNGIAPDKYDFILSKKPVPGKKATQTNVTHCDPSDAPEGMDQIVRWTNQELKDKYLETMLAFAKKARENQVDAGSSLDTDLGDITLG